MTDVSVVDSWWQQSLDMGNGWSLGGPKDGYIASGQVERTQRQHEVGKSGTKNWISFHID